MGLKEDEVDTFWPRVCVAADSLTSHVYSLVARNPPNSTGGVVWVACVGGPFVFV
jgi:hypothetical protein